MCKICERSGFIGRCPHTPRELSEEEKKALSKHLKKITKDLNIEEKLY